MARRVRRGASRSARSADSFTTKITAILLLAAVVGIGILGVFVYNNNKMMKKTVDDNKIYKNIYVNGIDLSGLTKEEATTALKREFIPKLQENTITISAEGTSVDMKFADFNARFDFTEAVETAHSYARTGSLRSRYEKIIDLREKPVKLEIMPTYIYDDSYIANKLGPIEDKVNIEPLNSAITRRNGQFIVTGSKIGKVINTDETVKRVRQVLDSKKSGVVVAVVDETIPQYTEDDFTKVQSLIGTFNTGIKPGNTGRNMNVETALTKINDVTLYPGEIFSTNKQFGSMTYDNGYRPAPVISGGKLVDDYGGGVCQVSTTLYNAVLQAELEVVERRNHSLKVVYADYGFDATLAGDYIDFKFKNNTDSPIFIEAGLVDQKNVVVSIYGKEMHSSTRKLMFSKELVETVPPPDKLETPDPTLPLGQVVTSIKPNPGYRYKVYKTVYEFDKLLEKVLVNTSYYKPTRGEYLVGTGENVPMPSIGPTEQTSLLPEVDPAPIQPEDTGYDLYPTIPEE